MLHPLLLALLLLAVVPKGAAAVTTGRIHHQADLQNVSDNHLLRHYSGTFKALLDASGLFAELYKLSQDR
ncbi:hypothetical protein ACWGCW_07840 [Streptomyces sp. NPDC054933]